MKRLVVISIATVTLFVGCGSTVTVSSPLSSQQVQQINKRVDKANAELKVWAQCTKGPLEKYDQCMISHGYSPDGS